METPILTVSQIKSLNLWIDTDIADDIILESCSKTQRVLLKSILGYDYWNSIYNQFLAGSGYTTADAYIMNNYIDDILCAGIADNLQDFLYFQLKSDGPRTINSSQSTIAPEKSLTFKHQKIQDEINGIQREMIKYMEKHRNDYPLYFNHFQQSMATTYPIYVVSGRHRYRRGGYYR